MLPRVVATMVLSLLLACDAGLADGEPRPLANEIFPNLELQSACAADFAELAVTPIWSLDPQATCHSVEEVGTT